MWAIQSVANSLKMREHEEEEPMDVFGSPSESSLEEMEVATSKSCARVVRHWATWDPFWAFTGPFTFCEVCSSKGYSYFPVVYFSRRNVTGTRVVSISSSSI